MERYRGFVRGIDEPSVHPGSLGSFHYYTRAESEHSNNLTCAILRGRGSFVGAKIDWAPTLDKSDLEIPPLPLARRESNFPWEYSSRVWEIWIIFVDNFNRDFLKKIYRRQLEGRRESFATKIPPEIPARQEGRESSEELNNTWLGRVGNWWKSVIKEIVI